MIKLNFNIVSSHNVTFAAVTAQLYHLDFSQDVTPRCQQAYHGWLPANNISSFYALTSY